MPKTDHRDALGKLKAAIGISWFLNFVILTLTIEAAILFVFLSGDTPTEDILSFVLPTLAFSAIVGVIAMSIISAISYHSIRLRLPNVITTDPKTQQRVQNIVEEMAVSARIPRALMPEVVIIQSADPNAFALSSKKGAIVGVTTGLLNILNREELQAVIGHEIGHIHSGDSQAMTKLIAMSSIIGIISGTFGRFFFGSSRNKGGSNNPIAIAIIVLSLVFLIVAPFISAAANALMQRNRESQADALSVQFTRNPSAMASALRKISGNPISGSDKELHSNVKQMAFFSNKHYRTHPPIEERIEALRRMGADPSI